MTQDARDIDERVTLLEPEVRRWKNSVAILCTVLAGAFLLGQAAPQRRTLEAQEFVLKEPKGQVQARLSSTGAGSAFTFSDNQGNARLSMSFLNNETGISLWRSGLGANNTMWLATFIDRGDAPTLNLYNVHGSYQGKITPATEGAGLTFWDSRDHKRVDLTLSDAGTSLSLFDADGRTVWSTPGGGDGESHYRGQSNGHSTGPASVDALGLSTDRPSVPDRTSADHLTATRYPVRPEQFRDPPLPL